MLKPALCGEIKKGLIVLVAQCLLKLTMQPLVIYVDISVCTIISAVCHWEKRCVDVAPLFDLSRVSIKNGSGSCYTVLSCVVLVN